MTRKKVTTDATKAKLPKPRKRKPKAAGLPQNLAWRVINREPGQPEFVPPRPSAPCMDWPADSLPSGVAYTVPIATADAGRETYRYEYIPPDTAPYPWPVRLLWWVDERIVAARTLVAAWLRALSRKVAP